MNNLPICDLSSFNMPLFTIRFDTFYNIHSFQSLSQLYTIRLETFNKNVWNRNIQSYPIADAND